MQAVEPVACKVVEELVASLVPVVAFVVPVAFLAYYLQASVVPHNTCNECLLKE